MSMQLIKYTYYTANAATVIAATVMTVNVG